MKAKQDAICAGCGKTWAECRANKKDKVNEDGTYDMESNQFICDMCYIGLIQRGLDVGVPKVLINNIKMVRNEFDRKQKLKQYDVIDTNASKWDVN